MLGVRVSSECLEVRSRRFGSLPVQKFFYLLTVILHITFAFLTGKNVVP